MKYGIGISFDGALARAGLFDRSGKLVARASAEFSGEGRAEAAEKLAELAQSLGTRTGKRAETLGLCVPAAVDGASGEILRWDGAPDMVGPWGRELSRRLGMPVQLAGCGNAAALAEARFGAGKKYESLVYLSLGAAVRCGAVCGGEIFEGFGAGGVAAEHMSVEVGGVPCACGRRGCRGLMMLYFKGCRFPRGFSSPCLRGAWHGRLRAPVSARRQPPDRRDSAFPGFPRSHRIRADGHTTFCPPE